MRSRTLAAVILASLAAMPALAEEPGALAAPDARTIDAPDLDTHPVISADATWAGNILIVIAVMFVSAAVVGPIVRSEMATETPVADSHDADASYHADAHGGHP